MRLPQPILQVDTLDRRHIHGHDGTAQGRIGRGPGLRATLHHFSKNVVCLLAVALLDTLHADLVSQIDGGP